MSDSIIIKDKEFKLYQSEKVIKEAVKRVARTINTDLAGGFPIFLVVLNGSFMFAADLLKEIEIPCEVSFIKLASYQGMSGSENVTELIGLSEDLEGRTVVIVEDIVDTGNTVKKLKSVLTQRKVKQIRVATALYKPAAKRTDDKVDYVGLEIGNDFVVGYGMDYDGLGRNLKEIYVLA